MITHQELFEAVRKILYEIWDPIGIVGTPGAHDEYDMYAPKIVEIILNSGSKDEIFNYLEWAVSERMELPVDKNKTMSVAEKLFAFESA